MIFTITDGQWKVEIEDVNYDFISLGNSYRALCRMMICNFICSDSIAGYICNDKLTVVPT